jgi:hypothetical protein
LARRFRLHAWPANMYGHKSSGFNPVRLAIRASIRGPTPRHRETQKQHQASQDARESYAIRTAV